MQTTFTHGYALLIGVHQQAHSGVSQLPGVANDISSLYRILIDPARCGYPRENVSLLQGEVATKANILAALRDLCQKIEEDPTQNATALVYFSGHGYLNQAEIEHQFNLIPYDADPSDPMSIKQTTIADKDWADYISYIRPARMLLIMDCCHAGASDAKETATEEKEKKKPTSSDDRTTGSKPFPTDGSSRWDRLSHGEARVVIQSSQDHERSYMTPDGKMSLFTYYLMEALTGHALSQAGATQVDILEVLRYLDQQVPTQARKMGNSQTPVFRYDGTNFPIALLLGGKGLGNSSPPSVERSLKEAAPLSPNMSHNTASITGNDNTLIQANSGKVEINRQDTTLNNSPGAIANSKVRAGGDLHWQNQYPQSAVNAEQLQALFAEVYQKLEAWTPANPNDPAIEKEELIANAQLIEAELKKGEQASPNKLKRLLGVFRNYAPSVLQSIANIIDQPEILVSESIRAASGMI